ncbi:hypothetical protein EVAR_83171_1 [Eumeta japonica]|uniref:Uncharacterized protein n=1 Tax=Eumeta variegata TaxID=151549 RepID=A0A4C1Y8S4_EUMVA|nr:hypothetical protein EVAR_83171_1 [Eumeta japonica]
MATPPQLKCMQLTCATDAPPIKCSGSGASDTVARQPSHCEARLNKEVNSDKKRCPSFVHRHTARSQFTPRHVLGKKSNPRCGLTRRYCKSPLQIRSPKISAAMVLCYRL